MAKLWLFIHSDAFEKEEEKLFFVFRFTRRFNDFDGHSMVSKMVIKFFSRPYNNETRRICL